jgi:ribosome-associated protein
MSTVSIEQLEQLVIEAMEDLKAADIKTINVEGVSGFTDRMVFASGTSTRHVKSIAQSVQQAARDALVDLRGIEGDDVGEWILLDLGDVVVHIMLPDTRQFYDIERLWLEQTA